MDLRLVAAAAVARAATAVTNSNTPDDEKEPATEMSLVDELGVEDIYDPIAGGRGRLFSTAGREAPIAEFTKDFLVLHPPQKPFKEQGGGETITVVSDSNGILLDEFGVQKRMTGARYKGATIYWLAEIKPGTTRHLVAWFDDNNVAHRLLIQGNPITTDMAYRLRNQTHDGELTIFPELDTE